MKQKPYWEMTTTELQRATRAFDESDAASASRVLTKEERRRWSRVKRKPGRPVEGQGFQRISVSLEAGLLKKVTAFAKKRRMSRSKLIAQAVRDVMAKA